MRYEIAKDMTLIREFFNLTQAELADRLGVERLRIARVEAGTVYPREDLMESFYGYCFGKGLNLNLQKEMFHRENIREGHILLTHASKTGIDGNIDLSVGRTRNDLGQGFYCGDSYEHTIPFVCRYPSSCAYFADFNLEGLNEKRLEVGNEWMLAIAYFRGKLEAFSHSRAVMDVIGPILRADYVVAPIADNRMFQIIDSFIGGEITDEQCKHCLSATNLGLQYVMLSDKALANLTLLERCYVSSRERKSCQDKQAEMTRTGIDKSRLARIQYRGKGLYIEELLQ